MNRGLCPSRVLCLTTPLVYAHTSTHTCCWLLVLINSHIRGEREGGLKFESFSVSVSLKATGFAWEVDLALLNSLCSFHNIFHCTWGIIAKALVILEEESYLWDWKQRKCCLLVTHTAWVAWPNVHSCHSLLPAFHEEYITCEELPRSTNTSACRGGAE